MSDYMKEAERLPELHREIVDDALEVVDTFGPWGMDINEDLRRQIVLADEVRQLRKLYSAAVKGRQDMRAALRDARAALNAALAPSTGSAEADRLVDEYGDAVSDVVGFAQDPAGYSRRVEATRAALLAHIQRGAEPDMYDRIAEAHDASLDEDHTGCRAILKECMRLLTAAPDHFRDATKMVPAPAEVLSETCIDGGKCHHACTDKCFRRECCVPLSGYAGPWAYAPAEVPMPEPVARMLEWRGRLTLNPPPSARTFEEFPTSEAFPANKGAYWSDGKLLVLADEARTYGDAREAAGYARGRAEAGRDAECQRRLFDVLLGEDGQAWKEAERYLETARPDLYVALRGEVK